MRVIEAVRPARRTQSRPASRLVGASALGVATSLGAALWLGRRNQVGRRMEQRLSRRVRYLRGEWQGVRYRLRRRHPDPEVSDDVLADRVRSALGPLEKRLDMPRVNVMVENHVVLLHGPAEDEASARSIEKAVRRVAGVRDVRSSLHVGLGPSDTRPSQGRARSSPSPAMSRLLIAAAGPAAAHHDDSGRLLVSVLRGLAEQMPEREWEHVCAHLPDDVCDLVEPAPLNRARRVRTATEFVATVAERAGIGDPAAEDAARRVFGALAELVPEEVGGVAAVLPTDLRSFWSSACQDSLAARS